WFYLNPPPCPGVFFSFTPVSSSDIYTIFTLVLQHCSTLPRAQFLLCLPCVLQIPSPKSFQPNGASEEALRCEIKELKQKDLALDQEIAQLLSEGYSLEELDKHISLLHEYNEIKDAGQMLLGKLAVIRGVTTKQLYPEYDLELSD
ncbi:DNA repair protein SWI5 homolog, partial [Motacilla alba alba]|uniref:DNA repair protein SWI5 homolog n=1 Tax=Motacilla alba alba TaxID=1094192 RepID=UPI0018D5472A